MNSFLPSKSRGWRLVGCDVPTPARNPWWACAFAAVVLTLLSVETGFGVEIDWPQFRGPTGDGHSAQKGLPVTWGESNHVRWQTPIHGRGWSSPVVGNGKIWLTTASEDGRELSVLAVNAETGAIVHDLKLFEVERPQFAHKFNTYASPTPVLEGDRVYLTFGSPATACLDATTGKVLWERRDIECNHYRGAGSSPILYQDLLLMNYDGSDHQFVLALDKKTGKTVWNKQRSIDFKDLRPDGKPESEGDWRKAFSTPHVAKVGGVVMLISQGAKAVYGYEPLTGRELWRVEERLEHSASSRPVAGSDLVYVNTGWSAGQILAIRPGHDGAVIDANVTSPTSPSSSSDGPNGANVATGGTSGATRVGAISVKSELAVVWKSKRNVPKKPSMLLADGRLYTIDDGGIATCLDAQTGAELWRERLGGNYSASPLFAEGRLYFFSEEGKTTVLESGREFKKVAENQIGDGFMASPAVTGSALILRTRSALYRIQN